MRILIISTMISLDDIWLRGYEFRGLSFYCPIQESLYVGRLILKVIIWKTLP